MNLQFYSYLFTQEIENTYPHKTLYMNIYSSVIYNSQKGETKQMSINYKMDKQKCGLSIQWNTIELGRNEVLTHATTWMTVKNIMLSRSSQSQRAEYYILYI